MKNIECLKVFLSGDKIDESFGEDGTFFLRNLPNRINGIKF